MDPNNYDEVVQDKDATLWQKVMNIEIESMYSNQVWSLVDPPAAYGFYPNCWISKSPDLIGVHRLHFSIHCFFCQSVASLSWMASL